MAAMDEPSLKASLEFMAEYSTGLSAVRYPRDGVSEMFAKDACAPFVAGKARALITHADPQIALIGYGTSAIDAATAAHELANSSDGADAISANVYDARFAKPVDIDLVASAKTRYMKQAAARRCALRSSAVHHASNESAAQHSRP